jgi:hypothetical protein
MKRIELEKLIENKVRTILKEDRLDSMYADYKVKGDRIDVMLKQQKAASFTKWAQMQKTLNTKAKELLDKKRVMNELKNAIESTETELKDGLREAIQNVVDSNEKAMTIAVECAGSTFTLAKETDQNKDTVIKGSQIVVPDYEKAWKQFETVMTGNDGMLELMNQCIKNTENTINIAEQVVKGNKRGVSIKLKENNIIQEVNLLDVWNKIANFFKSAYNKTVKLLMNNNKEVDKFSDMVNNLG